jgi:hypothetical protein
MGTATAGDAADQQRPRAGLQRIRDSGDRAGELAIGEFGHAHDGVNARRHAEGCVLRYVGPDADDIALHHLEHERAACGIALHQTG